MNNKNIDLNNHLFAQLERLGNEELSVDDIKKETVRAKSIVSVAKEIISNDRLVLDATIAQAEWQMGINPNVPALPTMLQDKESNNG